MSGRVLSEEELQRREKVLQNNVSMWGMQTDEITENLIATIRDIQRQLAEKDKTIAEYEETLHVIADADDLDAECDARWAISLAWDCLYGDGDA